MTFAQLINKILGVASPVLPIVITLIGIMFIWGMAKFILSSGDAEAHKKGRDFMVWSIIAIFVAVSVWGIVALVRGTFFNTGDLNPTPVDVKALFN